MRSRIFRRPSPRMLLRGVLFGVVLLLVSLAFLATTPGITLSAKAVSSLVSAFSPFSLKLSGVSGALPFHLKVRRIELCDTAGPWFVLNDLSVRLSAAELLHGTLRLAELHAAELRVERKPIKEKRFRIPPIPGLSQYPLLARGGVDSLYLGETILGRPLTLKAEVSIERVERGGGPSLILHAQRTDGKSGTLDVDYAHAGGAPSLRLALGDDDVIPHLLGLAAPVKVDVDGSGPRTDWHGSIHAVTEGQVLLNGDLRFAGEFPTRITATADANLVPARKLQAIQRFLGSEAHLTGAACLAKSGTLDLFDTVLSSPLGAVRCAGTVQLSDRRLDLAFQGGHTDLTLLSCREPGGEYALPAGFHATLTGPYADMTLRLDGNARDRQFIQTETHIRRAGDLAVDGEATLYPDAVLTLPNSVDPATLAWSIAYAPTGMLSMQSLALDHPALRFSSTGTVAFPAAAANINAAGVVNSAAIPAVDSLVGDSAPVPFTLTLSDRLHAPTVQVALSPMDIRRGPWQALDASLRLAFHLEQGSLSSGTLAAAADHCRWDGRDTGAVSVDATFSSADLDTFQASSVSIAMPMLRLALSGSGDAVRSTSRAAFNGDIQLDDLSQTAILRPHPLSGSAHAAFTLDMAGHDAPLRCTTKLEWVNPGGLPPAFASALGGKVGANLTVEAAGTRLTLQDATLTLPDATIAAHGWHDTKDARFRLSLDAKTDNLTPFIPVQPSRQTAGAMDLSLTMEGTPRDFSLKGTSRLTRFAFDRLSLRDVRIAVEGDHFPAHAAGKLTLASGNAKNGLSLQGGLRYKYTPEKFTVEDARLAAGKNRLAGALTWDVEKQSMSASADFSFPAMDALAPLIGLDCAGSARGKLSAVHKKGRLDLDFDGKAEKVRTPWLDVDALDGTGSLDDCMGKPRGKASLRATGLHRDAVRLDRATLSLDGDGARADIAAALGGDYRRQQDAPPVPFDLTAQANAALHTGEVTLSAAAGTVDSVSFSLASPTQCSFARKNFSLGPLQLRCGAGTVKAACQVSPDTVRAQGAWTDLPLSIARLAGMRDLEGTSSGTIDLTGSPQSPAFTLDMTLAQVRRAGTAKAVVGLDATVRAVRDGLWTETSFSAALADAVKAQITSRLPLNLSLVPPAFSVRPDDPLRGTATLSADLASVAGILGRTDDLPQGNVHGKFSLDGTVQVPRVSGDLHLENGGYEHLRYGAVLKNLNARVTADGSTFRIVQCAGSDGNQGTVTASGSMEMSFLKRLPFDVEIKLDRMRSIRMDYGTAVLSGTLRCAGNLDDAAVKGTLVVNEGDFQLPERRASGPVAKVVYTPVDGTEKQPVPAATATPKTGAFRLDLSLSVPGRLFLRAPVLETEWRGDMRFVGPLPAPKAEGDIRVARGWLDLVGQRFSLADSTVGFYHGDIRTPYMNVAGVCTANDITARIQLVGPPDDAQLTLSSLPALPQDEILSKLLFRKGVSQASPLQAIQIARTASMFSGPLSLPQFLTGNVKLPGVDLFDIRTGEKVDQTVVGVGKYINDKIYVEAEQGASAESGRVSAQVEVTPRVSVKADVGAKNRGGVGLLWKKDY